MSLRVGSLLGAVVVVAVFVVGWLIALGLQPGEGNEPQQLELTIVNESDAMIYYTQASVGQVRPTRGQDYFGVLPGESVSLNLGGPAIDLGERCLKDRNVWVMSSSDGSRLDLLDVIDADRATELQHFPPTTCAADGKVRFVWG